MNSRRDELMLHGFKFFNLFVSLVSQSVEASRKASGKASVLDEVFAVLWQA